MDTSLFTEIFQKKKSIIAMIHVFEGAFERQMEQALEDAKRLRQGGVDGLLVENYGCGYNDSNTATDAMVGRLAAITSTIRKLFDLPVGLNVLPNDYLKALSAADANGGSFIQMDHVTGEFRHCRSVDADEYLANRDKHKGIAVLGGIHPKYYRLVDPHCSLAECAKKAKLLADAVVITGQATGDPAKLDDLREAREAIGDHPIVIGSGLNADNAARLLAIADGAIVGTAFKRRGVEPDEPISVELVSRLMDEVAKLR